SECMRRGKSGDLPPELGAALVGRPKMNPGIDAGVDDFANAFAEGCPMALETWIGRARGCERHARVVVEEQPEDRGHCTAICRVRGHVLGKVRRGDKRCPAWIGLRRWIA